MLAYVGFIASCDSIDDAKNVYAISEGAARPLQIPFTVIKSNSNFQQSVDIRNII
jgi:hypothetical protein